MQIANQHAVSIHYTLTDNEGKKLDSSIGAEPLVYIHGTKSIVAGLEAALTDKTVGDKFTVNVEAAQAYGIYQDTMLQNVSKKMFEGVDELKVGMMFNADVSHGTGVVTITKIDGDDVTIDGNHPLAGKDLTFDVDVIDVRVATKDELTGGHVHGENCNH